MLERLGAKATDWADRWLPDPFVLALLLTLVAGVGAFFFVWGSSGQAGGPLRSFHAVTTAWMEGPGGGRGFWLLLRFAMQMCLILVTGYALAQSPPVQRLIQGLVGMASTPARATVLVAWGAMVLALINWGLGLVGGALLARQVGLRCRERGVPVHYPLLAAAGYTGLMVWHGGLSGSAPLKVTLLADMEQMLGPEMAAQIGAIPLSQTVLHPINILANLLLLALLPLILVRMMPAVERRKPAPESLLASLQSLSLSEERVAGGLGNSRMLAWTVAGLGLWATYGQLQRQGLGNLDPNLINLAFLFLGLGLHASAERYAASINSAARDCAGIILQFPFYAGIMGILAGTGLLATASHWMAQVGAAALPVVGFYSAGLVNLFVPSGGGQWAVQGPVLMKAALDSGVSPSTMVMALSYGDQWTNMLQPFWALPLLGITGVRAQDILGYTAVVLILSQFVFVFCLLLH